MGPEVRKLKRTLCCPCTAMPRGGAQLELPCGQLHTGPPTPPPPPTRLCHAGVEIYVDDSTAPQLPSYVRLLAAGHDSDFDIPCPNSLALALNKCVVATTPQVRAGAGRSGRGRPEGWGLPAAAPAPVLLAGCMAEPKGGGAGSGLRQLPLAAPAYALHQCPPARPPVRTPAGSGSAVHRLA